LVAKRFPIRIIRETDFRELVAMARESESATLVDALS
jgi:hypothetical protein